MPNRVDNLLEEKAENTPQIQSDLLSRLRGAFLGAALGDAVGLQVEGEDAYFVADHYPNGLNYPYKGVHGGYACGDWTDATDLAIINVRTLRAYFRKECEDPVMDLASRLSRWSKQGFTELGDFAGIRPESVVLRVLNARDFLMRPLDVACEVKGYKAENGAMTRSIACAFTQFPAEWAESLARVTHSDARSLACAITFTLLIRTVACTPPGEALTAELLRGPIAEGCKVIDEPDRRIDFMLRLTEATTLEAIVLDERDRRSYAVKTLACVMWVMRRIIHTPPTERGPEFFKDIIRAVGARGGDASANCCAAGAVLGALLGADDLPRDWLHALPNKDWLEREITGFVTAMV
jgi:ADP-ribosylglycohydrolase